MAADREHSTSVSSHEDFSQSLGEESLVQFGSRRDRKTLDITWHDENTLIFKVRYPSNASKSFGETRIREFSVVQGMLDEIDDFLKKLSSVEYGALGGKTSQVTNLKGVGTSLFRKLIPTVLQDEIRGWPNDTWITIDSDEQWIPWELLCDRTQFLGVRFMLFRLPRLDAGSCDCGPEGSLSAGSSTEVVVNKVVNVVGGKLRDKRECCAAHFANVVGSTKVVPLHEPMLADFMQEVEDADIVHMTCHGHGRSLRLQIAADDELTVSLMATSVAIAGVRVKRNSLVFANACRSGTAELYVGDFLSFGKEFFCKGVAAFIGTLGAVPIDAALLFAQAFYDALCRNDDGDIRRAYCDAKGNADVLVGPLYSFYGNPFGMPRFFLSYRKV